MISKGGKRQKHGVSAGYWNPHRASKNINAGNGVIGYKTALDYYIGKQPNDVKGDWLMHEYWFESSDDNNEKVDHALCKIYLTPKAAKKKKAEEEENEKLKKEDVEQLDLYQPYQLQPQQPHDTN